MPGRGPKPASATVSRAALHDSPSGEARSTSFWLWAGSVSSE